MVHVILNSCSRTGLWSAFGVWFLQETAGWPDAGVHSGQEACPLPDVFVLTLTLQVDVETQRAHFLDEHVEASGMPASNVSSPRQSLRRPWFACNVIRLHRQHFLQRVGSAIGLSAQTSISPKRWPPNCALPPSGCWVTSEYGRWNGVDLVIDQMVKLEHVDIAHRHLRSNGSPVRPSYSVTWPDVLSPACSSSSEMSSSWRRRTPVLQWHAVHAGESPSQRGHHLPALYPSFSP